MPVQPTSSMQQPPPQFNPCAAGTSDRAGGSACLYYSTVSANAVTLPPPNQYSTPCA